MGRQINIFMSEKDQIEFVQQILSLGDKLVDRKGNSLYSFYEINQAQYKVYILNSQIGPLLLSDGFVDDGKSTVIEFIKCAFEENGGLVKEGRLYIRTEYLDENQNFVRKSEEFIKWYQKYKKYITKNYKISKQKTRYIGPNAYNDYQEGKYKFISNSYDLVEF
jgi:hypothetical protein